MKNVGSIDRFVRIIVALALAFAAATGVVTGNWAIAAWVVAAVFAVTSVIGFCPAYRLIGVDTCRRP